jgi:hypothetical protein
MNTEFDTGMQLEKLKAFILEKLHKELIQKGKLISEKYDWDKTAALVWNSILKTAEKSLTDH